MQMNEQNNCQKNDHQNDRQNGHQNSQQNSRQNRKESGKPGQKNNIYLIGFMGVGKSSVSECVAKTLGLACIEMDEEIEKRSGMRIKDMFAVYGESYFRDKETACLKALAEEETRCVVSCGGGAVLRDENVAFMKETGRIILLTATAETVYERVKDSDARPVLNGRMNPQSIQALMDDRCGRYESIADCMVSTDGKTVEEICKELIERIS